MTNAHVVHGCSEIHVETKPGASVLGTLSAKDTTNDLALIKIEAIPDKVAAFRFTPRLGERVEAFGYPLAGILATSGNFSVGNITALLGLGDDSRYLQISVPVQPGNSGGPLLDQQGNLVGIVSAKLNALEVMSHTKGDIPQNVNFAIRALLAANFLQANNIKFEPGEATQAMQPADLAENAKAISVHLECSPVSVPNPTALSPPPAAPPPEHLCATSDDSAIVQPVINVFDAIRSLNIDLFADQWADDAVYQNGKTGQIRSKAQIVAAKVAQFARWRRVQVSLNGPFVVRRSANQALIEDSYALAIDSGGGSLKDSANERYTVRCLSGGRWVISQNLDYAQ